MDIVESIIFCQFGYPIFEGIFTLHTYLKLDHKLYGWKYYFKTFPKVYGNPYNSLRMRRYEFICPTTQLEN
jgi:hypothetical protein